MTISDDVACRTYRYLRLTIVALSLLLTVSVMWQIVHDGGVRGSISAYFYTASRSVLVGALVGIGAALITLKGREGAEDKMLNIAGIFAPLIALVPTPIAPPRPGECDGASTCIPPTLVDGVVNNVWALLVVGAGALAVAGWLVRGGDRAKQWEFGAAVTLWAAALVTFVVWRQGFLSNAHYVSAAGLFIMIIAIVVINARRARYQVHPPLILATTYGWIYRVIAGAMLIVATGALVLVVLQRSGIALPAGWRFLIEAAMILAFMAFWIAQTVQFWHDGLPDES